MNRPYVTVANLTRQVTNINILVHNSAMFLLKDVNAITSFTVFKALLDYHICYNQDYMASNHHIKVKVSRAIILRNKNKPPTHKHQRRLDSICDAYLPKASQLILDTIRTIHKVRHKCREGRGSTKCDIVWVGRCPAFRDVTFKILSKNSNFELLKENLIFRSIIF